MIHWQNLTEIESKLKTCNVKVCARWKILRERKSKTKFNIYSFCDVTLQLWRLFNLCCREWLLSVIIIPFWSLCRYRFFNVTASNFCALNSYKVMQKELNLFYFNHKNLYIILPFWSKTSTLKSVRALMLSMSIVIKYFYCLKF